MGSDGGDDEGSASLSPPRTPDRTIHVFGGGDEYNEVPVYDEEAAPYYVEKLDTSGDGHDRARSGEMDVDLGEVEAPPPSLMGVGSDTVVVTGSMSAEARGSLSPLPVTGPDDEVVAAEDYDTLNMVYEEISKENEDLREELHGKRKTIVELEGLVEEMRVKEDTFSELKSKERILREQESDILKLADYERTQTEMNLEREKQGLESELVALRAHHDEMQSQMKRNTIVIELCQCVRVLC